MLLVAIVISGTTTRRESLPAGEVLAVGQDPFAGENTVGAGEVPQPRRLVSRETWEALLPRLQEAAAADPEDAAAQRRLALAYTNLGQLDNAAAVYRRLLEREEDALVRNRLGNILRDQGDLIGAESDYRAALAADPTLPAPYANLAELLWRRHRMDEALDVLEEGLRRVAQEARPALERVRDGLETPPATTPGGPRESPPGT